MNKLLIGVIVAVVVVIGGYFVITRDASAPTQNQMEPTQEQGDQVEKIPAGELWETQEQRGTLIGYYTQEERPDWEGTSLCDSLVVSSGSEDLLNFFTELVSGGNTINRLNDRGELVVNIDLSDVNDADRAEITNSSQNNPVELFVLRPIALGRGVDACYSMIEILELK